MCNILADARDCGSKDHAVVGSFLRGLQYRGGFREAVAVECGIGLAAATVGKYTVFWESKQDS